MIIYCTINTVNSKLYIGQSKYDNDEYFGSGLRIRLALAKYGCESFIKIKLETNVESFTELDKLEKYWISRVRAIYGIYNVYNLQNGGRTFGHGLLKYHPYANDIIKKLSLAHKKTWSDIEYQKKMSKIFKNSWACIIKRKNASDRMINLWSNDEYRINQTNSITKSLNTKEIKNVLVNAHSHKFLIKNEIYLGLHKTCNSLKLTQKQLFDLCDSNNNDYQIIKYGKSQSSEISYCNKSSKQLSVYGITFKSITHASKILNISKSTILNKCRSNTVNCSAFKYL